MANRFFRLLTASALVALAASANPVTAHAASLITSPDSLVNPFVGTGSNSDYSAGNTFPGADVPHGMLQWSPDTSSRPNGGGYNYADSSISGFSLTHVSGVGCQAAGDIPILPITGSVGSSPGSDSESFSHSNETASPGYYSVALGNGTSVALTTSTHAGIGQFTFPASTSASLLLKLDSPDTPYVSSTLSTVGSNELTGSVTSSGFCEATNDFTVYFAIEFDQNYTAEGTYGSTSAGPGGAYVTFGTPTTATTVTARVGISYTSTAEAQSNLNAEVASETFAQAEASAQASWTSALDKIEVAGGTSTQQANFYTALYHAQQFPSVISDADGSYRGFDGNAHTVDSGHSNKYADFSNWDIYRSQAQLTALINPSAANDMAQSILDDYEQGGTLTKWGMNNGDPNIGLRHTASPIGRSPP